MNIPAYMYLRVSSKKQAADDADGPERQRETVRRYALANGYDIVREYADLGVSGTTDISGRKGLAEMLQACESNGVKTILVENADRLARDLMVSEILLDQFRKAGCRVFDSSGNDLTAADDPTRVMIRQVLGSLAQYNKSMLVLRMRLARERIRGAGKRCEGGKPFGSLPGEADTLASILKMRAAGKKHHEIAAMLNGQRVPTRNPTIGGWSRLVIGRILRRERARKRRPTVA